MADRADDNFERYYTEKLWELVPAIHRHEDGLAEQPGVLRAMVEIIAAQAAVLRRSQDRLWDDVFIDLCDEWAVPYLGDLVGTRMISALNPRGRRVDVAKTIFYRRRKGTVRVLEELISDITGWEGKVTESFRGLARCRHGLDPAPPAAGRYTGTPAGGTADLRDVRGAMQAGGPFDEFAHTADVRRARGTDGIWNIPKVVFHIFRIPAFEVEGVTPFAVADGRFVFDPSGREAPLYVPRRRLEHWDEWTSALPWEIPAPMSCRLLAHAEYELDEEAVQALDTLVLTEDAADGLRPLIGVRFRDEKRLREHLAEMAFASEYLTEGAWNAIRATTLVSDCGKAALLPPAVSVTVSGAGIPQERIRAANLSDWTLTEEHADLLIDPESGRFKFLAATPPDAEDVRASYWYGFPGPVGAGTYDRSDAVRPPPKTVLSSAPLAPGPTGVFEVPTSETYVGIDDVDDVEDLVLQAADLERPYVALEQSWILTAATGTEATLVLDGIWFGARSTENLAIKLRGAWSRVTISHCTLDPGGTDVNGDPIYMVGVKVDDTIDELVIDRSIMGSISVSGVGSIDRVTIIDSILDANGEDLPLIQGRALNDVMLRRVTVLGNLTCEKLDASEALITGHVEVTDTHNGCFRFSAAPDGSRVPRAFPERVFVTTPNLFVSTKFGQPGYTQLAETAPDAIARGAENGSEMGVWSSLINPIKLDGLGHKVEEYLPFGLIHSFVRRT